MPGTTQILRRIPGMFSKPKPPERLLDELAARLRHDLTEARVQAAAARLAAQRAGRDAEGSELDALVARLEDAVRSADDQRLGLLAQLRAAEARLQVERALLDSDAAGQPAFAVLERLVHEAEAGASAVEELRQAEPEAPR